MKVRDLPRIFLRAVPIIGGVLIILALANGLSYYIIDAQIPQKLSAWVAATISSKYVFLLILNLALLVVGCFMDIYSAILVVVPLIIPLGNLFGIHPVHLGIIFLANLELGYLTPPVGLNLYLASYRFNEPDRPGVQGRADLPAAGAGGGPAHHLRAAADHRAALRIRRGQKEGVKPTRCQFFSGIA